MVFSQICYAHVKDGLFFAIYSDIFATEMFGEDGIVKVVVTESENGEYWAATKNEGEYLYISENKSQTEKNTKHKEGFRVISVDVGRWTK